jgi:hypothetical protein
MIPDKLLNNIKISKVSLNQTAFTWMPDIEFAFIESFVVADLNENFFNRRFRTCPQNVQLILGKPDLMKIRKIKQLFASPK